MKKFYIPFSLLAFFISGSSYAQNNQDTIQPPTFEIKGLLLDSATKTALPYANIYILNSHKGMISNEKGQFSISDAKESDTLRFQYIGYATKKVRLSDLDSNAVVYLKEEITNLSEALVFGNAPNPASIVKKVLLYKDSNYKRTDYSKEQTFIREKENVDFTNIQLKCEKTTIEALGKEVFELLEEKIPKHTTSYTDFLGHIYFSRNPEDSIPRKIDEIRTVTLKEQDITELEHFETVFENVFKKTDEKEYWKVRSGIFASKINEDNEKDKGIKVEIDTVSENRKRLRHYTSRIKYKLRYSLLNDKNKWEFLHKTGRYKYTLIGGTRVNGEDVYIIDFTPKSSGMYQGRMFISTSTFALIRADYEYALGKMGRDFHLLGIGYTETQFSGSIFFEKKKDGYRLKYFSHKSASSVSIERKLSLLKKRERVLFDKKLEELKLDIIFAMNIQESLEYLVLENETLNAQQFADFEQAEYMNVIYVEQFDDQLWNGFSIIEPTQQMKEYKKQKVNYKVK